MGEKRKEEEEEEKKNSEDREMQEKVVDSLRDEIEMLKQNVTNLEQNVSICQPELNSERADKILVPPQGAGGIPPRHLPSKLGPGQLPDVSPDAVSVVRKETQGGAGLRIEEGEVKDVLQDSNNIVHGSSSRKPVMM